MSEVAKKMSMARAFTLRRSKKFEDPSTPTTAMPTRAFSMRSSDKPVDIKKISAPTQLLSTTNMLSYNAPDVSFVRAQRKASTSVSSGSSRSSAEDSDTSSTSHSSRDTVSTTASSVASSLESSPLKQQEYFEQPKSATTASTTPPIPPRRSVSTLELRHQSHASTLSASGLGSPEIPLRAPSHSKSAHEHLARKRSLQSISMSRNNSIHSISSIASSAKEFHRSSLDFFTGKIDSLPPTSSSQFLAPSTTSVSIPPTVTVTQPEPRSFNKHSSSASGSHHPFGKELEQLDEVAEEFGGAVRDVEREGDVTTMREKRLARFCVQDYLSEIGGGSPFGAPAAGGYFASPLSQRQQLMAWI